MSTPSDVVGFAKCSCDSREVGPISRFTDDESVRPWGHYEVLSDQPDFKAKAITVLAGMRLSYQRHARRSEHWFIVKGHGVVTIGGIRQTAGAGSAVDVPAGAAHRIENVGDDDLVFVEVQLGTYFGEDDIERLEDDFGRAGG